MSIISFTFSLLDLQTSILGKDGMCYIMVTIQQKSVVDYHRYSRATVYISWERSTFNMLDPLESSMIKSN